MMMPRTCSGCGRGAPEWVFICPECGEHTVEPKRRLKSARIIPHLFGGHKDEFTGKPNAKKKRRRAKVFARDNHRCVQCGARDNLTIDHIRPKSRGGSDALSNLQTLCRPCNERKGDSMAVGWKGICPRCQRIAGSHRLCSCAWTLQQVAEGKGSDPEVVENARAILENDRKANGS